VHEAERQGRTTLWFPDPVPSPESRQANWDMVDDLPKNDIMVMDGIEPVARNRFSLDLASGSNCKFCQALMLAGNYRRRQIKAPGPPSSGELLEMREKIW